MKTNKLICALMALCVLAACSKDDDDTDGANGQKDVELFNVGGVAKVNCSGMDVNHTTVYFNATMSSLATSSIDMHIGLLLGTQPNITINDSLPSLFTGDDLRTGTSQPFKLINLETGTKYYYAIYVVADGHEFVGKTQSFTTLAEGEYPTRGLVDLGLSVRWAACNFGAKSPKDCGSYYSWGETSVKDTHNKNSYSFSFPSIDKTVSISGTFHDVIWTKDQSMRLPTKEEAEELLAACDIIYDRDYRKDKPGFCIKSRKNGNMMFIPATGYLKAYPNERLVDDDMVYLFTGTGIYLQAFGQFTESIVLKITKEKIERVSSFYGLCLRGVSND